MILGELDLPPGQWSGAAGEYLVRICPSCGKRDKLYWNTIKAKGWCFSCHVAIRGWKQFAKLFGVQEPVQDLRATPDFSPLDHPSCWTVNAWDDRVSRGYLVGRGVTEEQVRSVPISWIPEEGCLAIVATPLPTEYPPGVVYRQLRPYESKWLSRGESLTRYGFGVEEFRVRKGKAILLVEGIFDLLALGMVGSGVGIFGSKVSLTWVDWMYQRGLRPVVWFDPDRGGRDGIASAVELFEAYGMRYRVFDPDMHPKDFRAWDPDLLPVRDALLDTMRELELEGRECA